MELLVPYTPTEFSSFPSLPGNPTLLGMVLESHLLFGGDGRGSDVSSSNPPAVTSPGTNKFLVDDSIAQPMESHVHGFRAFWLDS